MEELTELAAKLLDAKFAELQRQLFDAAQLIEELAKRVVALEERLDKGLPWKN